MMMETAVMPGKSEVFEETNSIKDNDDEKAIIGWIFVRQWFLDIADYWQLFIDSYDY